MNEERQSFQAYRVEGVNDHLYALHSCTGEILYLIIGDESALLVDTSTGVGDLKGVVESLTDKPLIVALTHGHVDHASGVDAFETAWLNPADFELAHSIDEQIKKDYIALNLSGLSAEIPIHSCPKEYVFAPLQEGQVFDLGGLHVSAWPLAGHTAGSMVFLIEEDGILITGDAANTNTFLFMEDALSLQTYLNNLRALQRQLAGRYHRVFLSHRDVDSGPQMIEEAIRVCQGILDGHSDEIPFEFLGCKGLMAKAANADLSLNDGTFFNIVYNPSKLSD